MARGSITLALGLTIVILASNAGAKPQAEIDPIGGIQTDDPSNSASNLLLDYAEDPEQNLAAFSDRARPVRRGVWAPTVPEEYIYTPGIGTHKINRHAERWHDAREICQGEGGDLAVMNSEDEALAVGMLVDRSRPFVDSADNNWVLIGFDDIHHDGKYVTVDGRSLKQAGYEKWAKGEPNNALGHDEDCGSMNNIGLLNDIFCSKKYAFVCELDIIFDDDDTQDGRADSTEGNAGIPVPTVGNGNGAQGSHGIEGATILFMCSLYLLVNKMYF